MPTPTDHYYPSTWRITLSAAGRLVDLLKTAGLSIDETKVCPVNGGVEIRPEGAAIRLGIGAVATGANGITLPADQPFNLGPWTLKDDDLRELYLAPVTGTPAVNVRLKSPKENSF